MEKKSCPAAFELELDRQLVCCCYFDFVREDDVEVPAQECSSECNLNKEYTERQYTYRRPYIQWKSKGKTLARSDKTPGGIVI